MKLLLDQDVFAVTAQLLVDRGHDVLTAAAGQLAQAEDCDLLAFAHESRRILITRDRDFGRLVFGGIQRAGVVYLRMMPATQAAVHRELDVVLERYSEDELKQAFVVVEPGRHRLRRLT